MKAKPASLTISERASRACRFRWLVTYGLGLRTRDRQSAQRAGSLWHTMMEHRWAGKSIVECMDPVKALVARDVDAERITQQEADHLLTGLENSLVLYSRRWKQDERDFETLATEQWIDARVRIPGTGRQGRARHGGVLDRVVVDKANNQMWLVEHKAKMQGGVSERDLERRRFEPQAAQYSLLWREHKGKALVGVIYDIASLSPIPDPATWPTLKVERDLAKRPPRGARPETVAAALALHGIERADWHTELEAHLATVPTGADWPKNAKGGLAKKPPINARPETLIEAVALSGLDAPDWYAETMAELEFVADPSDWPVTQRGKPGLSKVPPAGAIPQTLYDALALHGFEFGSQDWHAEKEEELARFERSLFAREWVRFTPEELELMAAEIYVEAKETDRDRAKVEEWRAVIESTANDDGSPDPSDVTLAIAELGPQFPRNGKMCWEFNRLCEHADLCYSRNAGAVVGYRVKGHRVTEEDAERAARPDVAEVADFGG